MCKLNKQANQPPPLPIELALLPVEEKFPGRMECVVASLYKSMGTASRVPVQDTVT